jgi:hypothetical protein
MATTSLNWDVPSEHKSRPIDIDTLSGELLHQPVRFQAYGLGASYTYETQGCTLSTCCPFRQILCEWLGLVQAIIALLYAFPNTSHALRTSYTAVLSK